MIVLDANVIIAYLDGQNIHHQRADRLLTREIDDDFGVNSLTLAEVLVMPARAHRLDAIHTVIRDLEIQELPFPGDTACQLAQLRADTRLKMPDCCVLLVAEHTAARVATFDESLAKAAATRQLETVTD